MDLLWAAAICTGLWLLFPKGFKYWVGCLVGTAGGLFFWGLFVVTWFFTQGFHISNGLFLGSLVAALVAGNGLGIVLAAKG